MIPFQPLHDESPALQLSPLLTATLKAFTYIAENGPIGLTPSKALKRYFVTWAAEAFDWPHYGPSELYDLNKVLNEADFMPLAILHDVWLGARLVRHYKGKLALTKVGRELAKAPATLWAVLANYFLCELDHSLYTRFDDRLQGHWGVFLNILNIEAQTGVTDIRFCSLMTGLSEEGLESDYHFRPLTYVHVLRPLAWAGLLSEHRSSAERLFFKTPLWDAALKLETDELIQPVAVH